MGKRKVEKGKSGNNETFVIRTKECSTRQIMGGKKMEVPEGKMGERRKNEGQKEKRERKEDRKE